MMTVTMATLACLPLPAWCASIEQGNFDIRRASVGQFAGILEVAVTESAQAGVVIEGEDRVLDGFRLQQVDGELQIRAPQVDGAVSVITGDIRGNGEVTINGRRYGPDDPLPEPTRITLTLVRGTALDILDLTGEARIGDLAAPLHVGLRSGTVTAGRIGDADIRIDGGGQVEIAAIDGNARLDIPGSGSIRVTGGTIGELVVGIGGAGSIDVMAPAASATGSIRGAGTVLLGNVATTPRIEAGMAGRVMVRGGR